MCIPLTSIHSGPTKPTGEPNKAIYDLVRRNQLPGVIRLGRRSLFDADEIARYIQANRTQE